MAAPLALSDSHVVFVPRGSSVRVEGISYVLWSPCERAATKLFCVTCDRLLANQGQLEMHIDTGAHQIVAWCAVHGWEAMQ